MSPDTPKPPPGANPDDFARWAQQEARRNDGKSARRTDGIEFADVLAQLAALPPETPEEAAAREKRRLEVDRGDRLARFRRMCPPEFMCRVDRAQLVNPAAFDRVVAWDGKFKGPMLTGETGASKTRAAWAALYRLHVMEARSFAWFPVKRLITEFVAYEAKNLADEFWRNYRSYNILFVDDLDKVNAAFESEMAALFQFYDWIYREHIPCITTTNNDRAWWVHTMGDAFARRLFDDAQTEVNFNP